MLPLKNHLIPTNVTGGDAEEPQNPGNFNPVLVQPHATNDKQSVELVSFLDLNSQENPRRMQKHIC